MAALDSKEFKKKYLKSKLKLKEWENEFKAQNGRPPTKVDIKSSPASIREYYKLYWKLKVQLLEDQILGDENLLESPHLCRSKSESVLKEYTNTIKTNKETGNDSEKNTPNTSKENFGEEVRKNDANTWGLHLNRTKTVSVIEKEKCGLMTETIAGRLFKGSSFKKRNPRKSLSFSKKSNKSLNSEESKSVDSPDIGSLMSPYSDCQGEVDTSLNGSTFSVESNCSSNIRALITTSASLSPLLSKGSRATEDRTRVQPVSLIQVVASDPSAVLKPSRDIDAGWVERCTQVETKEERKSSDSGFESMECSHVNDGSSDDDVIAGSDNELDESSRLSFLSQKRKPEASLVEDHVQKKIKLDVANPPVIEKPKTKEEVKKAILEKKIQTGKLNENFVKINLKKKVYVRGKKNFNYGKYKKKEWKNKKKNLDGGESGGVVQCYNCGETGHFSRYCHKERESKLLEVDEEEEAELPTLEEAEKMAKEERAEKQVFTVGKPEETAFAKVDPLYGLNEEGRLIDTPPEVFEVLEKFGHSEFRPGQEEAIMRILSGQSVLLTLATGGGKSLCYQLPAYLYAKRSPCITLVVSPLVSLMEDQVSSSSSFFKVGCLNTSQTLKKREAVIEEAKNGKLFALLVSPEAVVSGDFFGFRSIFRQLPPIAFACIDEIHCVSQWSHNFRPSYLMISKVLREKLGVTTILGLTATATTSTINSIRTELGIDEDGIISDVPLPENLNLSVSREENKDDALIRLLKTPRFKEASAILIYCTRRDECERLAVLIRTCLQDPAIRSGMNCKSVSWNAESYHAGMAAARRKQVQKAFMRGNLRIVVATIAFGMGINKQDIRAVVHYNMPKNFESYVQEIGRAGRDGLPAYCHLFLGDRDLNELRRHVHSNSVDRFVLRKLLQRVFIECDCKNTCEGHEVAFDCKDTIQSLDLPEENIHTLLCYLEVHEKKFIKVLTPAYINCRVKSYRGMKGIASAAKKCPHLAYACALRKEKTETLEFNVIEVANKLGWDSSSVKNQLKKVEWEVTGAGKWKKTGLAVEFSNLGFRVCSRGNLTPSELDEALDYLVQRVEDEEKRSLGQLDLTYSTFHYFAKDGHQNCAEDEKRLKEAIRTYFKTEETLREITIKKFEIESFDEEALASDVRTLVCTYRDNAFNGRAVARIFHGIQSPNYPASVWFKCKFWRKHLDKDFNKISRIATREILRYKI